MRSLSLISLPLMVLAVLLIMGFSKSGSPHGKNFHRECTECHNTGTWELSQESTFDHASTAFQLVGRHTTTNCRDCHSTLVFEEAPNQCNGCHTDVHEQSLGQDCDRCHTPNAWLVSNITGLHQNSRFPLVGAHLTADCYDCHKSESLLKFEPLGVNCVDCHRETFDATTEPNHTEAGFSIQCEECHRINALAWSAEGFNHDLFPLTLGHNVADCRECHTLGDYTSTSPECISCHEVDFNTAEDPNHVASQFSKTCTDCHNTNPGWEPAIYNHDEFPLTLGHNVADCIKCHKQGNYTNTPSECDFCHDNDFLNSKNPNHVDAQFDKTCQDCHTTNPGWKPTTYKHDIFPLTLGHNIQDCTDCHLNGNYANTSPDCVNCHQKDYNDAVDPNHVTAQFPNTCQDCHNTNPGWKPSTYKHDIFPLTLGHNLTDCSKCHINGNFNNTASDCYSCHQKDYSNTTLPNHALSQFPTTCNDCHTTNPGWKPATFDHDPLFPIYSGEHRGEWNQCTDCHNSGGNFALYSCIDCHEHNKTDMDKEHKGEAGYQYLSTACFDCHPTGKSDD